ncbi:MAG: hypothetical protein EOO01_34070, partial [Chitinophagaceae bacterium]
MNDKKRNKPGNLAFSASLFQNTWFISFLAFDYFYSMETTVTPPVTLTPGAIKEIRNLMSQEGFDTTQFLRVGVKGGGCSGM